MWYEKMKEWYPLHFSGQNYDVYFRAVAGLLDDLQNNMEETIKETFIGEANKQEDDTYQPARVKKESYNNLTFLDIHTQERGLGRLSYAVNAESDEDLQNRIRRIKYNRTRENLITDLLPVTGNISVEVTPDFDANFLTTTGASDRRSETVFGGNVTSRTVTINSESYGNYGPLDLYKRKNCFSILLDVEIRNPHSFFDNDYFFNNRAYYDERDRTFLAGQIPVLQDIITQKAPAGAGWRLLVKGFTGSAILDTAGQERGINA